MPDALFWSALRQPMRGARGCVACTAHLARFDCKAVHFGPPRATYRQTWVLDGDRRCVDHRASGVHTGYERPTLGSWMRRIILTSRTPLRAPSSSVLHRSSPACGGACDHVCSAHSASAPPMCTRCFARPPPRRRRGSGASAGPHRMTRREPPTFPSSAAAGDAPPRSPVLASGCRGRTSRGVTTTMRATPGAWPRVSTLATPHAWLRSSLPSSAGPPPGSVAIRLRARARARARTRTRAHAHALAHAHARTRTRMLTLARMFARFCFHVSLFCPACATGILSC